VRRELLPEGKKHKPWKRLYQIPSIGPIRAAVLLGILQTPHRFRTKRQLWTYSGLGIETQSNADHRSVDGQLQRAKKQSFIRGMPAMNVVLSRRQGRSGMRLIVRRHLVALVAATIFSLAASMQAAPAPQSAGEEFEVSFPASAHAGPVTGRVFVMIVKREAPEPRIQGGGFGDMPPIFGADVNALVPDRTAIIDDATPGYPLRNLREIPAGDYYVQALLNIYTEFHRSDGHTIWAHMHQWEGQQFNISPGNLYSEVQRVHLDHGLWTPSHPPWEPHLRSITLALSFAQFEVHPCLTPPDVHS
jgi:Transposase IS116/IS110/IS902 family